MDDPIDGLRMEKQQSAISNFKSIVILDTSDAEEYRELLRYLETCGVRCRSVEFLQPVGGEEPGCFDPVEFLREFGPRIQSLSAGEMHVLRGVLDGMTNKAISRHLDLSMRTIDLRKASLMKKLQVQSHAQLIREITMFETLMFHVFHDASPQVDVPSVARIDAAPVRGRQVPR